MSPALRGNRGIGGIRGKRWARVGDTKHLEEHGSGGLTRGPTQVRQHEIAFWDAGEPQNSGFWGGRRGSPSWMDFGLPPYFSRTKPGANPVQGRSKAGG